MDNKTQKNESTNQSAMFILDIQPPYKILDFDNALCQMTGYSKEDFSTDLNRLERLIFPEDFNELIQSIHFQLSMSNNTSDKFRIVSKSGSIVSVLCNGQIISIDDKTSFLQCAICDITPLENAANESVQAKSDLEVFAKSVPSGVSKHICDNCMSVIWANDAFFTISGYTRDEWYSKHKRNTLSSIYEEDLPFVIDALAFLIDADKNSINFRIKCKDGSLKWVNAIGANSGEIINGFPIVNMVLTDITTIKIAEMKAELEELKYHIISDISEEIPFEFEIKTNTITFADKYRYVFNRKTIIKDPVAYAQSHNLVTDDTFDAYKNFFKEAISGNFTFSCEYKYLTKDGSYEWYFSTYKAIQDKTGQTERIVGLIKNINSLKLEQESLLFKSQRDAMTGLYNKSTTESLVNKELSSIKNDSLGIMMIIDIDDFKKVNDTYGHTKGDEVIKHVAKSISANANKNQIAGRIGGDEFLVYLPNVYDTTYAGEKATAIATMVSDKYNGEVLPKITLSIGISITNVSIPYTTLFNHADKALYSSKCKGKAQYCIYDDEEEIKSYRNERTNNLSAFSLSFNHISDLFDRIHNMPNPEEIVNYALKYVCTNENVDRIVIFEPDSLNPSKFMIRSHVCNKDDHDVILPRTVSRKYLDSLNMLGSNSIYYSNHIVDDSKDSGYEEILYEVYEILQISIDTAYGNIGYVTLTNRNENRLWTNEEINTYTTYAKIISEFVKLKYNSQYINKSLLANQNLYNNVSEPIYVINKENHDILYYNSAAKSIFKGLSVGSKCYECLFGNKGPCSYCPINDISGVTPNNVSLFYPDMNLFADAYFNDIPWREYENSCAVNIHLHSNNVKDLSRRYEYKNNTVNEESHVGFDYINDFSNFDKFTKRVSSILKNNPDKNYALYYIDIKNFKYINETFGLNVGDKTLSEIIKTFLKYTKPDEAFSRVISDMFVLFKEFKSKEEQIENFTTITKDIKAACSKIQDKYQIDFLAGILVIDKSMHDLSVDKLIDRVITTSKYIVDGPGTRFLFYSDDMHSQYLNEASIENSMKSALENGEFKPYIQPKFSLSSNEIVGSEALVRWVSPNKGLLVPDSFIPLFERNGFIVEIDMFMFEEICKSLRNYIDDESPICPCSVNLSRITLRQEDLIDRIHAIISKYDIPPRYIEFEITENVFIGDHKNIIKTLNILKADGFSISMDDFGSGYSSLILLKDIPIDILKLDKNFIDDGLENPNTYPIMKSIMDMSKALNIKVVCEGIETNEQAEFIKNVGCETGQGYLYAKPMPLDEFHELLLNKLKK